jgi:hypothetical protein
MKREKPRARDNRMSDCKRGTKGTTSVEVRSLLSG